MKHKLPAAVFAMLASALLAYQCGSTKGTSGDFCDTDADCSTGLVCRNNICVDDTTNDCSPACQPDIETCFQGQCVAYGDPNDKDGDGSPVGQDCDDFNPGIYPSAFEYCDGLDNNCDGLTDEGCPECADDDVQACGTDVGECIAGVQNCRQGEWEPCSGTGPRSELCDGKDNDCDGLTDEICPCQDGDEFACGADLGVCALGLQTCEMGVWSGCLNGELPRAETCNHVDDDCDGNTDDGFNIGAPCVGVGECGQGLIECEADFDTRCSTMPGGSADESGQEICDTLDNDCDGLTDEGLEADQSPNACALAQELGGLPDTDPAGSTIIVTGNLWPPGDEDWYKVTATDSDAEDLEDFCDRFHFAIRFEANPAGAQMDIYVNGCSPDTIDCLGDDSYDHAYDYNAIQGGQPIGQCGCRGTSAETSEEGFSICSSETKTFYVRVYAGDNPVDTCANYQLKFTNGLAVSPP